MKIICSKSELTKSVNISLKAIPVRTTMPILECILIDARDQEIHFITNDTELGIETIVKGRVEETGIVAINAKMFSDIIRKLPDSDVIIQSDANYNVSIVCLKSRFALGGQSGEDFSYLPNIERDECVTISQYALRQVINQTLFSVANNENNKLMTGELFEIKGDILRVVALDGHRISIRRVPLKDSYSGSKVIVPGKTLSEISKIMSGEIDDMVNIYITKNHIVFEIEGTTIVSRLIEGEYFAVDQMISSDYEMRVRVNKQMLGSMIDRATLFVKENDKKPIIMDFAGNNLNMSIESPLGAMNEDLDIEKDGETVTLYLTNAKSPCFIRDDESTYTYLILPVNFTR